jgi:hypothetical protein
LSPSTSGGNESRRAAIDGDKEDLANMVSHIRACLQEEMPNTSNVDQAKIWIPSQVLIKWVQAVKGRYHDWQAGGDLPEAPAGRPVPVPPPQRGQRLLVARAEDRPRR